MAKVYTAPIEAPDFNTWFTKDGGFDHDAHKKGTAEYIAQLAELCKANGKSPLLGEVIRFQRGDGYAQYMVWRTQPLELLWLETGDAWSVEDALIRGLRVKDVREMVERERSLAELFGRR